jgi:uncharacterized protein (TIGR03435 family)
MTPVISQTLLAVSHSLVGSIIAKVTVTVALGLLAAWLARGNRAAVRHALLAATFGTLLLLPIAAVLTPPFHVALPAGVESRTEALPPAIDPGPEPSVTAAEADVRVTAGAVRGPKLSPANLLVAAWAVGVALFLLPVAIGLWQIRCLRRSGLPWRHGQSLVEPLALDAGIRRRVEVLLHEALPGPMTCGVLNPVIVLPGDAENWEPEDLNRAIVHELEHVRRGDSLSRCLARAACAVYWFHPLVWIAWRELVLDAEHSCDDAVLSRSDASAYADQLVGLAKRLSAAQRSTLLAMVNRADLATRVRAVLNSRQPRGRAGRFWVSLACGAAAVLVVAISPLRLVAAPQNRASAKAARVIPQTSELVAQAVAPKEAFPVTPQGRKQATPFEARRRDLTGIVFLAGQAQESAGLARHPAFDAASVKLAGPEVPQPYTITGGPGTSDPGRFRAPRISLFNLIPLAFGISTDQIIGPAWLREASSPTFTVIATMPPDVTKDQFRAMLQNLIVERFHLVFHHETRDFPGYELVVDKGGPKFKEVTPTQDAGSAKTGTLIISGGNEFPDLPGPRTITLSNGGLQRTKYQERTIAEFVSNLGFLIGSSQGKSVLDGERQPRVVDKTGLTGRYTFVLEYYSFSSAAIAARFPTIPGQGEPVASDPAESGPPILEAIPRQLGLRLNKTDNIPLDVIVVDSIEKHPTAD